MTDLIRRAQQSVSGKVIFIAILILLLLIPMGMIKSVINERSQSMLAAQINIAEAWGSAQTVGAPILVVPFRYSAMRNGVSFTARDEFYVLPSEVRYAGTVTTAIRYRGIFEVPVYTANLNITGVLPAPEIDSDEEDFEIEWDRVQVSLPISDTRSIRQSIELTLGDASANFEPGGARVAGFGQQLSVSYAALGLESLETDQVFSFDLELAGTGELDFLPLGETTDVEINSTWPSPSFSGAYLPESRNISDEGFSATWHVLDLGRGYPASWYRSNYAPDNVGVTAFGVDLILPIGIYDASTRAAKYAILFIGLTFLIFFLFELFEELRLHPLQYLLLGLANCIFFLLLLAISEHAPFSLAYLMSATASTVLIGGYSAAVLGTRGRTAPVIVALTTLYLYMYVTLRAETYALLSGALVLFAVLAFFMYATRHVDWYALEPTRETPE
jgi:inner membrane protein